MTALLNRASYLPVRLDSALCPFDRDIGQGQSQTQFQASLVNLPLTVIRRPVGRLMLIGGSFLVSLSLRSGRLACVLALGSAGPLFGAWLACVWLLCVLVRFWPVASRFTPFHRFSLSTIRARSSLSAQDSTLPLIGSL